MPTIGMVRIMKHNLYGEHQQRADTQGEHTAWLKGAKQRRPGIRISRALAQNQLK